VIHHVSISAQDPKHVADIIAELMKGRAFPFPGKIADSFMAVSDDEHGSMIEVYPANIALQPGASDSPVRSTHDACVGYAPFHLFLSVPIDRATVERIGVREGWRTGYFGRGSPGEPPAFHVIEFWIENRLMVEVATVDMLPDYIRRVRYDMLDADFNARATSVNNNICT
jgi:hypothetical protein